MSTQTDEFFNELKQAVESDELVLPSLPEVALAIREAVESDDVTTEQISDILSQDSSMSARLLQVVNSPLYRTRNSIDDLHMAVTRMGVSLVRDLVTNLAMKQMFQPTSKVMEDRFRNVWNTSVNVAAFCQMMTMSVGVNGIRKERALLAGLIHNIGVLPILLLAEKDDDLFYDDAAMDSLIWELQGRVGAMILENWNFSEDLIELVSESHNFEYEHDGAANLVDLIQFTLLQGGHIVDDKAPEDWSVIPAFLKMGVDVEVNVLEVGDNQEVLDNARESLVA